LGNSFASGIMLPARGWCWRQCGSCFRTCACSVLPEQQRLQHRRSRCVAVLCTRHAASFTQKHQSACRISELLFPCLRCGSPHQPSSRGLRMIPVLSRFLQMNRRLSCFFVVICEVGS
jgi:hypothetical protein